MNSDVIRQALAIVESVERRAMLKDLLLEALEEAIHIETGLDGVITTGDELMFPIGDQVGGSGDPSRYFVLHVDDHMQLGEEWDGNYHLDLMDYSSDTAEDDGTDAWLPLGSEIKVEYPNPEYADLDRDFTDEEISEQVARMERSVHRCAEWVLEVLTTEEWVTSRFDLLATWTPEARAEYVRRQERARSLDIESKARGV